MARDESARAAGAWEEGARPMMENLPILQVVLPLLAAPVCVLLRRATPAWAVASAVSWAGVWISFQLLSRVLADGSISYAVGGWEPPWGIELRIEPINAFVLLIVSIVSALVILAAPRSFAREVPAGRHYLAYAAFLLCQTGLLGMTTAGDAFNIFVFLEISSLSSYALISMGPHRRALTSAFRYLILGTTGGTFLLLGIGLLYMATGTLNIVDLNHRLGEVGYDRTVLVGLACVVVGTSIKLALLPLGAWLPNAYTYAPSAVTAFLAATATKVAYYVLLRFLFRVFGPQLAFERFHLDAVLLPLAVISMFLGAVLAAMEKDVKLLLAYSSLSQIGYMVLGLSLVSVSGLTGGIVHLFNHALMKSGLFLVIAAVALRLGSCQLEDWRGLGRRMPLTMAAFVVGGLSLIGVPLTVGFVSKWYLVLGAVEQGRWLVALLILLSSLLALIYVWKVVEVAYLQEPPDGAPELGEAPFTLLVPIWLLAGACLYFGIFADGTVGVARTAAEGLLGGLP
ncbi:MAG: monovalent cation/H+ antiporter subunit D family protein [Holophagales bacterium]|nr:monovalent cation/H+ antiporter subunit D family protein [Holophagales bacterium]